MDTIKLNIKNILIYKSIKEKHPPCNWFAFRQYPRFTRQFTQKTENFHHYNKNVTCGRAP